jgi:lysophospholipase L1-like esterase
MRKLVYYGHTVELTSLFSADMKMLRSTSLVLLILFLAGHPLSAPAASADPAPRSTVFLRIMPMGDSITAGVSRNTWYTQIINPPTSGSGVAGCTWVSNYMDLDVVSYRRYLLQKLYANGVAGTFVGSVGQIEGLGHEGHPGWTIRDLDYCVQHASWLTDARPDFILLHIGTNDAGQARTPDEMIASLDSLLQHIYAKLPNTTEVIVAQIIPAGQDRYPYFRQSNILMNEIIAPYNAKIPRLVKLFRERGYHVSSADMAGVIRSDADLDRAGLHPEARAAERMADIWAAQIIEVLNGQSKR